MSETIDECDICYEPIPADATVYVVESQPGHNDGLACEACYSKLMAGAKP
jgi:hypothetical protein